LKKVALLVAFGALLLPSAAIFGQDDADISQAPEGGITEHVKGLFIPAIPGAPFSAKVNVEITRKLADGNMVARRYFVFIVRDKEGRRYRESRDPVPADSNEEPRLVRTDVTDPLTKTRTTCRPVQHTCWLSNYQPEFAPRIEPTGPAADGKSFLTRTPLGTAALNGLVAEGTEEKRTFHAGSIGNVQPIVVTNEYWYSPRLKIDLRVKRSDPRTSNQEIRVSELKLADPDPASFAAPLNYRLIDMRSVKVTSTSP
jgi:hypothetical protein